ncbi:MAG: glutamyl-tRNA reductase [Verrucomicrobia bacterium]|nr:glutamyl-tRNA reductase [Verrucomicrobiota bacterium]
MNRLAVVGINFRSAPLAVRELAALHQDNILEGLHRVSAVAPTGEFVLLSTCNRTELYVAGIDVDRQQQALIQALWSGADATNRLQQNSYVYCKQGKDAAEHLMAVAASLDSMVVGETEVLGQVKQAYHLAQHGQTVGKTLHRAFQTTLRIAKRVHTETDICRGRVSVSSVAVEFAERVFESLQAKTVMVIGAGETAELTLRSLVSHGVRDVLVLNRSLDRARELAEHVGGKAIQFDLLADYLTKADVVISSVSAPHVIIRHADLQAAVAERRGRPVLLLDIAVPRNIEPSADDIENVYLYHIDDLQQVAAANLSSRQESVDKAWAIVRQGVAELAEEIEGADLNLLLEQLDRRVGALREDVLHRAFAKERLATLPAETQKDIRDVIERTINKMMVTPRDALKHASRNGQWPTTAQAARDLFGLEDAPPASTESRS